MYKLVTLHKIGLDHWQKFFGTDIPKKAFEQSTLNLNFFLTATWLPQGQLWATVEKAAPLTQC